MTFCTGAFAFPGFPGSPANHFIRPWPTFSLFPSRAFPHIISLLSRPAPALATPRHPSPLANAATLYFGKRMGCQVWPRPPLQWPRAPPVTLAFPPGLGSGASSVQGLSLLSGPTCLRRIHCLACSSLSLWGALLPPAVQAEALHRSPASHASSNGGLCAPLCPSALVLMKSLKSDFCP